MTSTLNSKRTFAEAVEQHYLNKNIGENGMLQYSDKGVGSELLVLSQLVRGGDVKEQVNMILQRNDPDEIADLFVLAFITRNARGGKGEKKLSYDMLFEIWGRFPDTAARVLPLFVHFGYWKDLFLLLGAAKNKLEPAHYENMLRAVVNATSEQLLKDVGALNIYKADTEASKHPNLSLLAKWLPREGSSLDKKTNFVEHFVHAMWPSEKDATSASKDEWKSSGKAKFRKIVAELTSHLAIPEVLLAAKREDEIEFSRLASKATMVLRKVLLNEDKSGNRRSEDVKRIKLGENFKKYLVDKGLKGKQLMPHEIVNKVLRGNVSPHEEEVLDKMWKDLWQDVAKKVQVASKEDGRPGLSPARMVPMADVSCSMIGVPMEVSIAMSIGLSEIAHPAFQNLVLTFAGRPEFHKLNPGDSIVQKVKSLRYAKWDMSTNFEAAFDLILEVARKDKLNREDMPALIVFSDMQFNQASMSGSLDVMHDVLRAKTEQVAKELGWSDTEPSPIVYWNLRNTHGHPVDKQTEGTVLLSGFSPAMLRLVLSGDALEETEVEVVQKDGTVQKEKVRVTPEQVLRKALNDPMYDPVRAVLATSEEGCLKNYKPAEPVQDEEGYDLV